MVHISYCSRVHSILVHYDTYQVISTGVASFLRGGGDQTLPRVMRRRV